ncbi:MAG: hypothetical protein ACK4YO_02000 [Candidatus Altarchaeaceae archaeon]
MEFPKEVITKTKKGKVEVRCLISRGEYVIYGYKKENGNFENKQRIFLKDKNNNIESYFIIPMKDGRKILINAEKDTEIFIWNENEKKVEKLF